MARKKVKALEDDLTGGPADETVRFSLDGIDYEIDLSAKNAERLRSDLDMYVAAARRVRALSLLRDAGRYQRRAG
ncbi:histone-like nucleoid-structuring protein Lsr2 [Sporichthya polymorpha]|uniref:histone-like nucleoid-structuring protein Lsr2 n=1 Tax=Sporichthya polymorpha TaxID=35751 RepID=UPI0003698250|nr:Lsr2 family protein [Sporichthya polymorpha]